MNTKPAKTHYSEVEVAVELGVSVEELRSLIRMHIMPKEDEIKPMFALTFQPADLLLLRLLATQSSASLQC